MIDIITSLLLFISPVANMPIPDSYPEIHYASVDDMLKIARASGYFGYAAPNGMYIKNQRKIYLLPGWDSNNTLDMAVLAHELTHWLQDVHDVVYRCPQESEKVAFDTEAEWIRAQGKTFPDVTGIGYWQYDMLTRCPTDIDSAMRVRGPGRPARELGLLRVGLGRRPVDEVSDGRALKDADEDGEEQCCEEQPGRDHHPGAAEGVHER